MLAEVIAERRYDEGFESDVSGVIDDALRKFATVAHWQVGLRDEAGRLVDRELWPDPQLEEGHKVWRKNGVKLEPLLWYGITGLPEGPWVITEQSDKEALAFWSGDPYEVIHAITDETNLGFSSWYVFEHGGFELDMEAIKRACPINLSRMVFDNSGKIGMLDIEKIGGKL